MSPLSHEFTTHHVNPSINMNKLYTKFDGSNMINFGRQSPRTDRMFNGLNDHDSGSGIRKGVGGGIEFRAHEDDESGVTSPPLWQNSPPTDRTPLQSHIHNHHHAHYLSLSPTSRTQAVARGRDELMEMVKHMPEATYELSLKDLVEYTRNGGNGQTTMVREGDPSEDYISIKDTKKKKKKKIDQGKMLRSSSINETPFLLKMFVPSLGLKKKKKNNSPTGTCAKVSPRPVDGEKFADKDWWKKRFTVAGETETTRSSSSGSSDSSRSRNKGDSLPSCWFFLNNKKSKTTEKKGRLF